MDLAWRGGCGFAVVVFGRYRVDGAQAMSETRTFGKREDRASTGLGVFWLVRVGRPRSGEGTVKGCLCAGAFGCGTRRRFQPTASWVLMRWWQRKKNQGFY